MINLFNRLTLSAVCSTISFNHLTFSAFRLYFFQPFNVSFNPFLDFAQPFNVFSYPFKWIAENVKWLGKVQKRIEGNIERLKKV